jgi:hypothetical protein
MLGSGLIGPLNEQQRRSLDILVANVDRLTRELDALAELIEDPHDPDPTAE